jgi:hypothetical protein
MSPNNSKQNNKKKKININYFSTFEYAKVQFSKTSGEGCPLTRMIPPFVGDVVLSVIVLNTLL